MLEVTALGWLATFLAVLLMLTLDFALLGRRPHALAFREAALWSGSYIAVALAFGVVFGAISGWAFGAQYFTGYVVEKSLSIDNLFVWLIIVRSFAVPVEHQARALTFGIVAALILRAVFIGLGAALLAAFSFGFLLFGILLVTTAIQLFRHRDEDPSAEDNVVVLLARRILPLSPRFDGGRLTARRDQRCMLTPMFLVIVAIGTTDVVFALDSIPAVFGITQEAYIVLAANVFALLGLRPLYFLVAGLLDRLVYLSTGLSLVLLFIGVKLVLHYLHLQGVAVPEISSQLSLAVVATVIAITAAASIGRLRRQPGARAHAGALRAGKRPRREPVREPASDEDVEE